MKTALAILAALGLLVFSPGAHAYKPGSQMWIWEHGNKDHMPQQTTTAPSAESPSPVITAGDVQEPPPPEEVTPYDGIEPLPLHQKHHHHHKHPRLRIFFYFGG